MSEITENRCLRIIAKNQASAPVDVHAIAREMGLAVYETKEWDNAISGQILKNDSYGGSSGYVIFLNGKHSLERRRFTLAHEIALFVRHRQLIGDGVQHDGLYRSSLAGPVEIDANRMAANILVPRLLLHWAFFEGVSDPADLAERFQVSRGAMAIQMGIPPEETSTAHWGGEWDFDKSRLGNAYVTHVQILKMIASRRIVHGNPDVSPESYDYDEWAENTVELGQPLRSRPAIGDRPSGAWSWWRARPDRVWLGGHSRELRSGD